MLLHLVMRQENTGHQEQDTNYNRKWFIIFKFIILSLRHIPKRYLILFH